MRAARTPIIIPGRLISFVVDDEFCSLGFSTEYDRLLIFTEINFNPEIELGFDKRIDTALEIFVGNESTSNKPMIVFPIPIQQK